VAQDRTQQQGLTSYDLFILAVSVLSIVNILLYWLPLSDDSRGVITIIDASLSVFFLFDFGYRLSTAPSRTGYFFRRWGWADLLGSLPFTNLRLFRLFRVIRVIRVVHHHGFRRTFDSLLHTPAGSALAIVLVLVIVVIEGASIAVLRAEDGAPDANILNASDAVWWGLVTVATVGYGDKYPVTNAGRIIGSVLIILGVGLFGVVTGYLANRFVQPVTADTLQQEGDPGDPGVKLTEIRQLLDEQDQGRAALAAKVDELERLLRSSGNGRQSTTGNRSDPAQTS